MSVRAYKVREICTEKSPTFNLWHDGDITDIFANQIDSQLNIDNCGMLELSEEDIEQALEDNKTGLTPAGKKVLNRMLVEAVDGYVQYHCF